VAQFVALLCSHIIMQSKSIHNTTPAGKSIPIIKNNRKSDPNNEYNIYTDHLEQQGLSKAHNKTRYTTNFMNIDSSARTKQSSLTTQDSVILENKPLFYDQNNVNLLWFKSPNHEYSQGDRITVTGITTPSISLRTEYLDNGVITRGVEFTELSKYVKINTSPNMSFDTQIPNDYDLSDVLVTLSGFQNDSQYIGNIAINELNTQHQIILQQTTDEINDLSYFYIMLSEPYVGDTDIGSYNITMTFNHIGGIPLNILNAEYPLNDNYMNGYHTINTVKKDLFSIKIPKRGYYKDDFGTNNIYVAKILEVNTGYPDPNSYTIMLNKMYNNVVSMRLVGITMLNTMQSFRTTETFTNTKMYWKNYDDGDTIYSIQIPSGHYDCESLANIIQSEVLKVPRITHGAYTNKNMINVKLNRHTNITTITSFKEAFIPNPIINVHYDTEGSTNKYTLTIEHQEHKLHVGDNVTYSGMISHLGISATLLNQSFAISDILDENTYTIILTSINLISDTTTTYGGYAVKCLVANKISLLFNYTDTFGNELGFRNVGETNSITIYNNEITNKTHYVGSKDTSYNGIMVNKSNYILMTCNEASNVVHIGQNTINNVFAKIIFDGCVGKLLDDEHVQTPIFFYDTTTLSKLSFAFYYPTGELFNFLNLDHSFVIELITLDETPDGTGIVSVTGREY